MSFPQLHDATSYDARGLVAAARGSVAVALRLCSDPIVKPAPGNPFTTGVTAGAGGHAAELRGRLTDLFTQHSAQVARLAYRLLGREDEVDDIVQDVFISLFRHLDGIRQSEALRGWLQTTTVRMVRRRLRVRRIGFLLRLRDRAPAPELTSSGASGEDRAALWKVHRALEGVGVNARIAWVFRYLEEKSIDEVAQLCDCSTSTAKRRIAEAHRVVKGALSDD